MIKHRVEKSEPNRTVDGGTNQDITEYWEEEGVTVRHKTYARKTPFMKPTWIALYEEGEGSGLQYVVKKYNWLNDNYPGHLQEIEIYDWKPSTGKKMIRVRECYTETGAKYHERRFDDRKILSEILYFDRDGRVFHRQHFEDGSGDYLSFNRDGVVTEFGTYAEGRLEGKRYRLSESCVTVEEFTSGKSIFREKLGVRVWAELLRERGIS